MKSNCPNCGEVLAAPFHMEGDTHQCPTCGGVATVERVTTMQMVITGLVLGGLSLLATFFWR
jgi:hypothetical protein